MTNMNNPENLQTEVLELLKPVFEKVQEYNTNSRKKLRIVRAIMALFAKEKLQDELELLYEIRSAKVNLPVHGGTDSLYPTRYEEVVHVSSIDIRIQKLETEKMSTPKQPTTGTNGDLNT